jgi:uncharacterized protein (DUF1501 family)
MAITRRSFLKSSAAAAAALTVPHPIFRGMAHAAGPSGAIVVILQMEGGNDGLNMVVRSTARSARSTRPRARTCRSPP